VEKSSSWYSYKGERIGQGRENAKQFLKDNPDIAQKLEAELRVAMGLVRPVAPGANGAPAVEAPPTPKPAPAARR